MQNITCMDASVYVELYPTQWEHFPRSREYHSGIIVNVDPIYEMLSLERMGY